MDLIKVLDKYGKGLGVQVLRVIGYLKGDHLNEIVDSRYLDLAYLK